MKDVMIGSRLEQHPMRARQCEAVFTRLLRMRAAQKGSGENETSGSYIDLVMQLLGVVALECRPHVVLASVMHLSLSTGPSSCESRPLLVKRPSSPSRTLSG